MPDAPALMTIEELAKYPAPIKRTELVRGRLIVRDYAGFQHGDVAARILVAISNYLAADRKARNAPKPRGRVLAAQTGFTLARNPDTVRAPDLAYVRDERLPTKPTLGPAEIAPDLAVEVLSPSDRKGNVAERITDWLAGGVQLVWIVDPVRRVAEVHRADGSVSKLSAHDVLQGEELLPGFAMAIADIID